MLRYAGIIFTTLLLSSCGSGNSGNDNVTEKTLACDPSISDRQMQNYRQAANYSDSEGGDAVLIQKCGKLVFEHYSGNTDKNTPHILASGTKSFSCAIAAFAEQDGLFKLDDRVSDTISEWQTDISRNDIQVRHLLSLTSGIEDATRLSLLPAKFLDTYHLAINESPKIYQADQAAIYGSANFHILSAMIERTTGGTDPVDYLNERLFSKLGISESSLAEWVRDTEGKPQLAGGAKLTGQEWIKYGQFFLNKGQWNNEQIVPEEYLSRCIEYDNPAFSGYGLSWWLNKPLTSSYDPNIDNIPQDGLGDDGSQISESTPQGMYMAAGAGKQRLYIIPSKELVILRFGQINIANNWSDDQFLDYILEE